ncbi:thioredoxin domain-containing protein [Bacillus salitolerans]|uniref:Thioredoxin domain-containing protein n=1 Tax=Bacillus salitolerans TaxID=1437434 RepID=A0ABW4LKA5_9BACI
MLYRFCLTVCSFLLLSSCQFENRENDPRLLSLLEADALLVSNEDTVDFENNYYDAILEIKKLYPTVLEEVVVVSHDEIKKLKNKLEIETYPTLLLISNKKVITKIQGKQEKDEILYEMNEFLHITKNNRPL